MLKLKISAKVILTINTDVQDRLINDQKRDIRYTEFVHGSFCKVYVKSSDEQDHFILADTIFKFLLKNAKLRFQ